MEGARAQWAVDRVDAEGYEPDLIGGAPVGEFRQLEPVGSADKLDVCVWRADPATYEYLFENEEAFHVLEGAATVRLLDSGERIDLRAGNVGYFRAGTRSIWTITEPFKKFTVIAN